MGLRAGMSALCWELFGELRHLFTCAATPRKPGTAATRTAIEAMAGSDIVGFLISLRG
jgi:hypothetical protein